jgi:hypothetical protein
MYRSRSHLGEISTTPPLALLRVKAIEIHAPVLLGDRGGVLSLSLFSHKVCQSLGLDRHLGDVGYVKPHELESPFGDPPHHETVLDNFPEPIGGYHMDQVTLKIMQELALCN